MRNVKTLSLAVAMLAPVIGLNITGEDELAFDKAIVQSEIGLFKASQDIGSVGHSGSVKYDADANSYAVSGSGENIWGRKDAFHYAWTRHTGDVSIEAAVRFVGNGKHEHRKAGLMIRSGLGADAAYADIMLHGDGLLSLQYRSEKGGETREIKAAHNGASGLKLERIGNYLHMSYATSGDAVMQPGGGSIRIPLGEEVYVGLAVGSHDNSVLETAIFEDVKIGVPTPVEADKAQLISALEVLDVETGNRRIVYRTDDHIEAPNWSLDGETLVFNSQGLLYQTPVEGGLVTQISTGELYKSNNDHGISPDGKWLVISDQSESDNQSRMHILPIEGGEPRLVTPKGPSYWHGWSPDGQTLTYVGYRPEIVDDYEIFTVSINGGAEIRLTASPGLDDGPEYSPDGQYIYFNSVRSGNMQIWRMDADGSNPTQLTFDDERDWFPHPSPDGKRLTFISYGDDVAPGDHPANKDVSLRIMDAKGGPVRELTTLFGGQGTINVPSWSPDGRYVAFVSYRLVP